MISRSLIKASFPKFYNCIMTGRLMNRLSKDIFNVDTLMFSFLQSSINMFLLCLGFFITFFTLKFYLLYVFIMADGIFLTLLFFAFQRSGKEVQRIGNSSPDLDF